MQGKTDSPEQAVLKMRKIDRLHSTKGLSIAAAAKRVEVAEWTVYRWCNQYGGMHGDDARHIKELECENARPKRLLAVHEFDNSN